MTASAAHLGDKRRSTIAGATFSSNIVSRAVRDAFVKLNPRHLAKNPVILTTEVVAVLATFSAVAAVQSGASPWFAVQIAVWLWATVLFANFAESIAEGRGKAAADSLRAQRVDTQAKLLTESGKVPFVLTSSSKLGVGDLVLVETGDMIPTDGEIIEGVASVNEAASLGLAAIEPAMASTGIM